MCNYLLEIHQPKIQKTTDTDTVSGTCKTSQSHKINRLKW